MENNWFEEEKQKNYNRQLEQGRKNENIKSRQDYLTVSLIAYFLFNGIEQRFKKILFPEMFGKYGPLFKYIKEKGNGMCADLWDKVGGSDRLLDIRLNDDLYISSYELLEGYITEFTENYIDKQLSKGETNTKKLTDMSEYRSKVRSVFYGSKESNPMFEELEEIQRLTKAGLIGLDTGFPLLNKYTHGFIKSYTYTLGAFSGTGKSKFTYDLVNKQLNMGHKVMYISLEVGKAFLLANLAANKYQTSFIDVMSGKVKPRQEDFKNLSVADNIRNIDDIVNMVESECPDIVFIDFIQNVKGPGGTPHEMLGNIAREFQALAKRANCVVFNVSQIPNECRGMAPEKMNLKGSGDIYQSSDGIFILTPQNDSLVLTIQKNKVGKLGVNFDVKPNFATSSFTIEREINASQREFL